jgi:hypothetical protein
MKFRRLGMTQSRWMNLAVVLSVVISSLFNATSVLGGISNKSALDTSSPHQQSSRPELPFATINLQSFSPLNDVLHRQEDTSVVISKSSSSSYNCSLAKNS